MIFNNITGIILAGGKSSRMGENKALLKIKNEFIIERILNILKSVFQEVIIISNEPELYEFLEVKIYKDIFKIKEPIAGIHSGLINSSNELNFIISCDMPLINKDIIVSIINYPGDSKIKVPRADGYIQELCGLYNKSLIPIIESLIKENQSINIPENRDVEQSKRHCKLHTLINSVDSIIIEDIEKFSGYKKNIFLNINNKLDYIKLLEII